MAPVVRFAWPLAMAGGLLGLCACHPRGAPPAVDPALLACVPSETTVLAGLDLGRLRASPLANDLPPAARSGIEALRDASYVLIAWTGKDLLWVARGQFREAPAGAVLLGRNLAVSGPAEAVRGARARHDSGKGAPPEVARRVEPAAAGAAAWLVAQGTSTLPGGGDIANLNKLLHLTGYASVTARLDSSLRLDAAGFCASPDRARELEESTRGLLSIAAGMTRQQSLSALLRSAQVRRDGQSVHIALTVDGGAAREALGQLGW